MLWYDWGYELSRKLSYQQYWRKDIMARGPMWIEAYEEYLINRKLATRDMTSKLSDDEVADYYFKVIKEKNMEDDADEFVHKWCMTYK